MQGQKATAGVSYVLASDSQQKGVEARVGPLPHIIIRPPDLVPAETPAAHAHFATLRDQACRRYCCISYLHHF